MPKHDQKVEITLKDGSILNVTYDYLDRDFFEIRNGAYYFYELDKIDSWREND